MSRYIDADALKEIIMDMRNHAEPSPCLPHQTMLIPDRMVCDKIDAMQTVDAVPVVRCGECGHYHSEDDPAFCDELCTIHIDKTDGCLRGIKRGGKVGYRAADGERKDGERRTDGE